MDNDCRWCRDCIDLLISNTYLEQSDSSAQESNDSDGSYDSDRENSLESWEEFLPYYGWMERLKNLVILTQPRDVRDEFSVLFTLYWLWQIQGESLDSLERLWIDYGYKSNLLHQHGSLAGALTGPVVKSLFVHKYDWPADFELNAERFCHMEHLADTNSFDGLEHLLHLKYISGECHGLEVVLSFLTLSCASMIY